MLSRIFRNYRKGKGSVSIAPSSLYSTGTFDQSAAIVNIINAIYVADDGISSLHTKNILDVSSNVGGNLIELASLPSEIYGNELDPDVFDILKKNVGALVPSEKKVNLSNLDATSPDIIPILKQSHIVYLDPPWGGPVYKTLDKEIKLMYSGVSIPDFISPYTDIWETIILKSPLKYKFNHKLDSNWNYKSIIISTSDRPLYRIYILSKLKIPDLSHIENVDYDHISYRKVKGGKSAHAQPAHAQPAQSPQFSDILETDFIKLNLSKTDVIKSDRLLFQPAYKCILHQCELQKLTVSNVNVILGKVPEYIDSEIIIYTSSPYKVSLMLSNVLHQQVGPYVKMSTISEHERFTIEYDSRIIAKIMVAKSHALFKFEELVSPVKIGEILYMPPELELIEIYRNLYDPDHCEEWFDLQLQSAELFELVKSRVESGISLADIPGGAVEKCTDNLCSSSSSSSSIKKQFMKTLVDKKYVLIGFWSNSPTQEKIQLIYSDPTSDVILDITEKLSHITTLKVTQKKQHLYLPNDLRTEKYTFYVTDSKNDKEIPILDLFNSGTFELIPYFEQNGIFIGNMYVQKRYAMIDLWIIKIIHRIKKLNTSVALIKINNLIKFVLNNKFEAFGVLYEGVYQNYNISRQINQGKIMYPYRPAITLQREKKYRS